MKLLVFNWKMNPTTLKEAGQLFYSAETGNKFIIAPPSVYLPIFQLAVKHQKNIELAAQNAFWEEKGAYTGEISPKMLKNLGVEYVIVGHSERRNYLEETDEMINKKVHAAIKAGLKVILCVGENLVIRKKGERAVEKFIADQIKKDLKGIGNNSKIIVAYEPIWAIGTGRNDTSQDAVVMAKFIKKILKSTRVLYGGSVNSKNISAFINQPEIDGALIGHASVDKKEFKKILHLVN